MEEGIIHAQREIASVKIERNGLLIPKQAATADFEIAYGERKELLNGSLAGKMAGAPRDIGGAIGIESDVNDGLVE